MAHGWSPALLFARRHRLKVGTVAILICVVYFFYLAPIAKSSTSIQPSRGIPTPDLQTFKSHAINNTVVIVPVNTGMLHLVENLLCSLSATSFDPNSIVFWALDEGAQATLRGRGFATYRDASLWAESGNLNAHGNSPAYHRMMRQRPRFYMDFLSTGHDLLMIDADLVFWQSPLVIMPQNDTDREAVDMVYSTDAREFYTSHDAFHDEYRRGSLVPPICNGLFWMKSNNETISLWSEMLQVFEDSSWMTKIYRDRVFQDDQRGMDVLLNDGRAGLVGPLPSGITEDMMPESNREKRRLNVRLLDQTQVVNGQLFMFRENTYAESLKQLRGEGKDRIAVHMNWNTEIITKEEGARKKKIFFIDDNGRCKVET
ncbi:uncharacterized protein MAM_00500 [Metarhizium album ARSEF 1941]|uniref:Nucleotide-diphospho-sugar transferase domain-containing protein n=1 Tax=Metarhizium album (strain ARSEF 1941) TaxID=1081103 RepID=A0A0B2X548_METAS|nr:uncharacterized protein MAM_00500 [Metarhizium album ARSEF 1941]KHO01499.1 hypothetical protein MAM_00500 [Metarhizium album ARSEF 1941]